MHFAKRLIPQAKRLLLCLGATIAVGTSQVAVAQPAPQPTPQPSPIQPTQPAPQPAPQSSPIQPTQPTPQPAPQSSPIQPTQPTPQPSPTQSEPPASPAEGFESRLYEQLNLTPDQTQKIQAIQDKYRTDLEPPRQSFRQAYQELQQLMEGDGSTDQIRKKHLQVETLQQRLSNLSFERQLAIRNVLTVEQRRQQADIMRDPDKLRELFQQQP